MQPNACQAKSLRARKPAQFALQKIIYSEPVSMKHAQTQDDLLHPALGYQFVIAFFGQNDGSADKPACGYDGNRPADGAENPRVVEAPAGGEEAVIVIEEEGLIPRSASHEHHPTVLIGLSQQRRHVPQ